MTKLWGGRYENKEFDARVLEFTSSLDIDQAAAMESGSSGGTRDWRFEPRNAIL